MVYHQHHPTWQAGRKVQLFDNGMHRPGPPRSRVVVINPENDEVEWEFTGKPEPQFLSANIAGADRMPNGNNLVCEGASGRLFEITSAGEVVWEWVSPFATGDGAAVNTQIFRAHRYGLDHPAISGRNIDPRGHVTLNRMHGLGPAWGPRGRRGH
jgi:hypothetical protein